MCRYGHQSIWHWALHTVNFISYLINIHKLFFCHPTNDLQNAFHKPRPKANWFLSWIQFGSLFYGVFCWLEGFLFRVVLCPFSTLTTEILAPNTRAFYIGCLCWYFLHQCSFPTSTPSLSKILGKFLCFKDSKQSPFFNVLIRKKLLGSRIF